jgi:sugar lactone lactonase YvrE
MAASSSTAATRTQDGQPFRIARATRRTTAPPIRHPSSRQKQRRAFAGVLWACGFHRDSGDLYIADAYMGLMRVGPSGGEATVLATEAAGVPLSFTNGVDVDQLTGDVYFTSSSSTYTRAQHEMVTATGDSTGRILRYDPRTSQVTVIMSDVTYPNGIAVSADRTHLVVASTGPCKLLKVWIKGPKFGTSELFADLPGYPDNVRPAKGMSYHLVRTTTCLPAGSVLTARREAN